MRRSLGGTGVNVPISDVMHGILISKKNAVVRPWIERGWAFSWFLGGDLGTESDKTVESRNSVGVGLKRSHFDCFVVGAIVEPSCMK